MPSAEERESPVAIIAALLGNLGVAIAKGIAAVLTGSGALLAETAHSIADSVNEGLLYFGVRQSERPPTNAHPFGFGKERYFWSLVVALSLFVAGGIFSLLEMWERLHTSHEVGDPTVGFVVLGVALLFESASLGVALRQARNRARAMDVTVARYVRDHDDPAVRVVLLEDSAAVLGLAFAAAGLALSVLTGNHRWDAIASGLIGVELIVVALFLAADARAFLIGEAAPQAVEDDMRQVLERHEDVERVMQLLTMRVGARRLLVVSRLSVRDDLAGGEIERLLVSLRGHLIDEFPRISEAFLEVNPSARRSGGARR